MASTHRRSSWPALSHQAVAIIVLGITLTFLVIVTEGMDAYYSNSFISPNSARDVNIDDSNQGDITLAPSAKIDLSSSSRIVSTTLLQQHKVKRFADPILSRTAPGIDDLISSYKNVNDGFDSNDVELSGRVLPNIRPSKTNNVIVDNSDDLKQTVHSGEVWGAPQGRSLQLQEPQQAMNATATSSAIIASSLPSYPLAIDQGRQSNPDIQDIITGIVKLLNGKVNVQANTAPVVMNGRPLRPLSTRINNRGPPRITDLPPLPPDFDVPAPPLPPPPLQQMPPPPPVQTTRMPTPYPFDLPPHNTSPAFNKRPSFYRPVTIPPWNNRRTKPPRRPSLPIPPYKPVEDVFSNTSNTPIGDVLTLDLGTELLGDDRKENSTTTTTTTTVKPKVEVVKFEKKKDKSSSKMQKHSTTQFAVTSTSSQVTSTTTSSNISPTSASAIAVNVTSSSGNFSESSIDAVGNDTELAEVDATPVLESSIQDVLQTLKDNLMSTVSSSTSTPTEGLPMITSSSSSSPSLTIPDGSIGLDLQTTNSIPHENQTSSANQGFPYYPYRPRPGIVLDDTEYKPGGSVHRHPQPIVTRPPIGQLGDIFDITVSAIQGPGGASAGGQGKPYVIPVDIDSVHGGDVITSPVGNEGFVSIDGKRTYLNLFGDATTSPSPVASTSSASVIKPSAVANTNQVSGTGYAVVDPKTQKNQGSVKPTQRRPIYGRPRPAASNQPPVRIDTCIVGDDSTCDSSQNEICRTELGVSACHCRPGNARRKHRDPCRKIVSVLLSLRVDRLYDRRIVWVNDLMDKNSDSYQKLAYEAERALDSAMSMTPFSDEFLGAKVNGVYQGERSAGQAGVFVNLTLQLDENTDTSRPMVTKEIQKHLLGVIQRRSNNVGNSALWVDSPPGSISNVHDLDECSSPEFHDCHSLAKCINVFGGFRCECKEGYKDQWVDSKHRAGRYCEQCSPQHCNNRGECKFQNGQESCICTGNYYGNQCELDGEVLGVAIGASVAAVIIIGLTLVCLVMWSRRWNREQKAAVGSPVFGYMATASNTVKAPVIGAPPYQLTLEDRLRWAQIADVMAQANHYAPEPGVTAPTRPSSAMFGFHNMSVAGTLPHGTTMRGTLPPVPLPRLNLQNHPTNRGASIHHGGRPFDTSSSEEEDKADLLGRNFQVPRPKSRSNASIANQSGIYYDVDYDQNEIYKQAGGIPMSTYTMGRSPYYRN